MSQRALAARAGIAYKTVQLLESGGHDPRLSTLARLAASLGYPQEVVQRRIMSIFDQPPESIAVISERLLVDEESWKIWLFEFVDAFRSHRDPAYVAARPAAGLSERMNALLASTVETLCEELSVPVPPWCCAAPPLDEPWFVSGVESLKAMALMESPIHFRKRQIFVLENFLSRR